MSLRCQYMVDLAQVLGAVTRAAAEDAVIEEWVSGRV